MKFPFSVAVLGLLSFQFAVWAGPTVAPLQVQRVFTLQVDVEPNRLLPIPANRVKSQIPVFVLTNTKGSMLGVQVGTPDGTVLRFELKDGKVEENRIAPVVASRAILAQRAHTMEISAPVMGIRELFFVDGTKLDPDRGGALDIRYVSSPILGTTHDVKLLITRVSGRWLASVEVISGAWYGKKERKTVFVQGARISSSFSGVGFERPEYQTFDPLQPPHSMKPQPIYDPRQADHLMKKGQEAFETAQKTPYTIGYGVRFQIDSSSAK